MKNILIIFICSLFLFGCKAIFAIEGTSSYSSKISKCPTLQCYSKTKAGVRCKNKTSNCSGRCHIH